MRAKAGDATAQGSAAEGAHERLRAANRAYADAVHLLVEAEASLRAAEGAARDAARRRLAAALEDAQRAGDALARAGEAYRQARVGGAGARPAPP